MCGIVGFYSKNIDNEKIINNQLATLIHRGPDDQGVFLNKNIAFGHSRLAIIDINHAKQPMFSHDKNYVLIFNGEIYNYLELRKHLISKGINFKTHSDTEVLLNMYIYYGEECVSKLNGMFAFAIYNKKEDIIFLARDHLGIKPLYYTSKNDFFTFASEVKAILKHPEVKTVPDMISINEYLQFQIMLGKHTLFKNIHKLDPATYMVVKKGKIIKKINYWKIDYFIDNSKSEKEFCSELLSLLTNSTHIQSRSDVPIGAYLSGGIDSSTVSTLCKKNYFGDFHTFTGGYKEGKEFDETHYAQLVHKSINSVHQEIFPTAYDFLENFEKIIYHMDYPEGGPGVFSQYMVSKLASTHVKVVLGGQGGDEIFGGYTRYAIAYLEQALKGAIFETSEEGNHVVTLQSIIPNMPQLKNYIPLLKEQFKEGLFAPMDERYYRMINRSHNLKKVYNEDFLKTLENHHLLDKFKVIFNSPKTESYFNKMTHFDLKTLLPALLHIEDRVSMAVSLESRVPILDYRIIELASQIPPLMKFAGGRLKSILINSVNNLLPKEIINRKDKMGFPTPINKWLSGELKKYALDILTSTKAKNRGFLNTNAIEKEITKSSKFSRDLWGALNLEIWFKTFID